MAVFWFFGNTTADFKSSSLSPIGNRLLLRESSHGLDWVTRATQWLKDEKKGAWLAVVDDACLNINPSSDEAESFWKLLNDTIPTCSHGTLLITSRMPPQKGLIGHRTLEVGEMNVEEFCALTRSILPEGAENVDIDVELADIGERTPRALMEAIRKKSTWPPSNHFYPSCLWRRMLTKQNEAQSHYGHSENEIQAFRRWFLFSTTRRSGIEGSSHVTSCDFIPPSANTLTSMNNLTEVLSSQGKYDEAEEMHK